MQNKMHNLLFISYFFPPSGGISCQRAMRFAKYLPKFGWRTTVLTYDGKYPWRIIDRTLSKQIDMIETIKVKAPEIDRYFKSNKRKLGNLRTLVYGLMNIDVMSVWVRHVIKEIPNIIAKLQPDLILLTVPPFSSLELVKVIKIINSKIPVVVDMRDLYWILNPSGSLIKKLVNRHQRSTAMDKIPIWLSSVDGFIAPTNAIIENIYDDYNSPSLVVPTPYDPDDFINVEIYKRVDKIFKILHSGRIYRSNKPQFLFKIFSLLPSDILKNTQLILQGYDNDEAYKIFSQLEWAKLTEFVSHSKALSHQSTADVNLVYVSESLYKGGDLIVPGKIFDYIGAGRPIYAIGPKNGALLSFVEENKLGFGAPSEFPELCAGMIAKIFRMWEHNELHRIPEKTRSKFSANIIVKKLSDFLNTFIEKRK